MNDAVATPQIRRVVTLNAYPGGVPCISQLFDGPAPSHIPASEGKRGFRLVRADERAVYYDYDDLPGEATQ